MARIGTGTRNRTRIMQDVCADCGAPDPGWASINRGILICDGCCSVHRSLGHHISQVKSLKRGTWHHAQLSMVHALNSSGANNIWEHTLLDPSTAKVLRRKPQPKDPIHPNKADFIRAKHQMMSFVFRPNREETLHVDRDVSCQLHASVRTANLETSLRLLSLGADPNYFNVEKGNCPLHVAATAGQSSQVELLVIYGADPGALDKDGRNPVEYARDGGFVELAERLIEFQYELTDRLTYYLCAKKPDHKSGQHWIVPEMQDLHSESMEVAKEAKCRLISLPSHSLEELACDVYDEVDRRETDAIWLSLHNQSALLSDRCSVPFLPVNPEFSSTRNQGRQKLARFNAREFATLIIDLLVEVKRRMDGNFPSSFLQSRERDKRDATSPHHTLHTTVTNTSITTTSTPPCERITYNIKTSLPLSSRHDSPSLCTFTSTTQTQPVLSCHTTTTPSNHHQLHRSPASTTAHSCSRVPTENDDEPLYDSVASEDDYSSWERRKKMMNQQDILNTQCKTRSRLHDSDYQEVVNSPERSKKEKDVPLPPTTTVSLDEYFEMKRHLELSESRIKELQDSNIVMSAKLNELSGMIHSLKEENDSLRHQGPSPSHMNPSDTPPSYYTQASIHNTPSNSLHSTPHSRNYSAFYDSPTHSLQNGDCGLRAPSLEADNSGSVSGFKHQRPYSMFESRGRPQHTLSTCSNTFTSPYSYEAATSNCGETLTENSPLVVNIPSQDEVVRKTENITKRIQELLSSAREDHHEKFIPCAEHINLAVVDMSELFPKSGCPPEVCTALQQLVMSASRLQGECRNHVTSQIHTMDRGRVTQVIQCAYDIAKAAKNLVTTFQ